MTNILIFVTGSVAAIKLPLIIKQLQQKRSNKTGDSFKIRVVLTEKSLHFFNLNEIENLLSIDSIYRDKDEWSQWNKMGDPVLHIELRNWADIGVIAPLDANTMGKLSNGICDNLVSCIVRAWDMNKKLLYAPAMNVHMWNHPITDRCIKILNELGYIQIGPISKKLACGDYGMGAMSEVDQIVAKIIDLI